MDEIRNVDDLVERNGLFYEKFTDVPFTGEVTGWIFIDEMRLQVRQTSKMQGRIKDGKKDGPWVSYYENGQLSVKGTYKVGQLYGPYTLYHYAGQLEGKGTYKDGKRDGSWTHYHDNGTVNEKYTGTFKDGVRRSSNPS